METSAEAAGDSKAARQPSDETQPSPLSAPSTALHSSAAYSLSASDTYSQESPHPSHDTYLQNRARKASLSASGSSLEFGDSKSSHGRHRPASPGLSTLSPEPMSPHALALERPEDSVRSDLIPPMDTKTAAAVSGAPPQARTAVVSEGDQDEQLMAALSLNSGMSAGQWAGDRTPAPRVERHNSLNGSAASSKAPSEADVGGAERRARRSGSGSVAGVPTP